MEKTIIIFLISLFSLSFPYLLTSINYEVRAEEQNPEATGETSLNANQPIKTESRFDIKLITTTLKIERKTVYKDDPEQEAGQENVVAEGADGWKTTVTKVSYYEGEEFSREIVSVNIQDPTDKIVSRGTKIVWRTLDTPEGPIKYWKKMRVYATHYDSRCPGCNETTAIGLKAGKGVIAVDPSVIKMRSQMYIPGYGKAIAGDTGGAIKGNIIDLGFDDARTAGWTAHYIDIYLL